MIEKVVSNQTLNNLKTLSAAVENRDKFIDFFHSKAYPLMDQLLFNKDPTLPAIESNHVQLFVSPTNKFSTKVASDGKFETGAQVLGESLAASYYRLKGMQEFENIDPTSMDYMKQVFLQINKMLAMLGFRDFERNLVPSLHRPIFGTHPELDVYRYDCSPAKRQRQQEQLAKDPTAVAWREDCTGAEDFNDDMFAVPDQLAMSSGFVPEEGVFPKKASAIGQAEIVRGVALMLEYFRDWKGPNDFDKGMGEFLFQGVHLFPKTAFVNLTVGLMTTPVRSFKKPNTPLKLFNVNGTEIKDWLAKDVFSKDPVKVAERKNNPDLQLSQAVIPDFSPEGTAKTIRTQDIAAYIIALNEFLDATDGIEGSNATLIKPSGGKPPEVLNAIIDGRKQLKMLMYGMSGFLMSRLQDADGGFWHEYSLETYQVINKDQPRTLEDQVAVMQAMMKVYHQWGGNLSLEAATEAYFFMNQKLWNQVSGFYAADESQKTLDIKPQTYLDTLYAIGELAPRLSPQSRDQAQKIFDFYTGQFLKWNNDNQPLLMEAE